MSDTPRTDEKREIAKSLDWNEACVWEWAEQLERGLAALREALEKIVARGPYSVNGGAACATCTAFWHPSPVVTKFQAEHHYKHCAFVIAREALRCAEGGQLE